MKALLALALTFAVALSGCSETDATAESAAATARTPVFDDYPQRVGVMVVDASRFDLSDSEKRAASLDALSAVEKAVAYTDDWRKATANVDRLIASTEADANPYLAPYARTALMRVHLIPAQGSAVESELARHLRQTVEEGSPNVELVFQSLERLGDALPTVERRELASQALANKGLDEPGCVGGDCAEVPADAPPELPRVVRELSSGDAQAVAALRQITSVD